MERRLLLLAASRARRAACDRHGPRARLCQTKRRLRGLPPEPSSKAPLDRCRFASTPSSSQLGSPSAILRIAAICACAICSCCCSCCSWSRVVTASRVRRRRRLTWVARPCHQVDDGPWPSSIPWERPGDVRQIYFSGLAGWRRSASLLKPSPIRCLSICRLARPLSQSGAPHARCRLLATEETRHWPRHVPS